MYYKAKMILFVLCILIIILGIIGMKKEAKYKKDTETVKKILDYFKTAGKEGVDPKIIPEDIVKTGYLVWMQKDKTIIFKNGKYYLNKK